MAGCPEQASAGASLGKRPAEVTTSGIQAATKNSIERWPSVGSGVSAMSATATSPLGPPGAAVPPAARSMARSISSSFGRTAQITPPGYHNSTVPRPLAIASPQTDRRPPRGEVSGEVAEELQTERRGQAVLGAQDARDHGKVGKSQRLPHRFPRPVLRCLPGRSSLRSGKRGSFQKRKGRRGREGHEEGEAGLPGVPRFPREEVPPSRHAA